jgi:hypothetical protein
MMDDKKKMVIIGGATLIILGWVWYGFGSGYNNGRIESAGDQLEQAIGEQQEQATTLESAKRGVENLTESNRTIQSLEQSDESIIGECQQILERVRERVYSQTQSQESTT